MAASSSPPAKFRPSAKFHAAHLDLPPSSPLLAHQDGEVSPSFASFDASFASSMSISADHVYEPSPLAQSRQPSSPYQMDISPAPVQPLQLSRPVLAYVPSRLPAYGRAPPFEPVPTAGPSKYPFLQDFFQSSTAAGAPPPRIVRTRSPDTIITSPSHGAKMSRAATLPLPRRPAPAQPFNFAALLRPNQRGAESPQPTQTAHESMGPPPPSSGRNFSATRVKYNTAPLVHLQPPAPVVKRLSEPNIPTTSSLIESSPVRMEVDSSFGSPFKNRPETHPRSLSDSHLPSPTRESLDGEDRASIHDSGASDRLADLFANDLSPIPISKKRFFSYGSENSPTPQSPSPPASPSYSTPSIVGGVAALIPFARRPFEKASSISSMSSFSRRRTSGGPPGSSGVGVVKGITKRPSLASVRGTAMEQALSKVQDEEEFNLETFRKRQAQVATNGKPGMKIMRRAYSVADAFITIGNPLSSKDINLVGTGYRASTNDDGYFSTMLSATNLASKNARKMSSSVDIGMMDGNAQRPAERGSPLTGFRTQEEKGKALPCFGVKEDGLMRISSATLDQVVSGAFTEKVSRYLIIDCRFSYEFDGGHITEAVNLPTTVDVEQALLAYDRVPSPSTSEDHQVNGKTVLIFHCEFSAKRAPTSAKHLRSKDRLLNVGCYPSVHYPEVYVLQGGYADFWKNFPDRCEGPRGYVTMDDPNHLDKRSVDLNAFRQQKRQFNRAKSFTFGEATSASTLLQSSTMANSRPNHHNPYPTNSNLNRQPSLAPPMNFVFPGGKPKLSSTSSSTMLLGVKAGGLTITEEEHDGDSSFGTTSGSSPGGGGDSPCPGMKMGRPPLKFGPDVLGARRPMERAQTSAVLMFGR